MKSRSPMAAWLVALSASSACESSVEVGSRYLKSVLVTAAQGATIRVADGESTALAGASLEIAPGALDEDTRITLEVGLKTLIPSPDEAVGSVAIWGPADQHFKTPALMILPLWTGCELGSRDLYLELEDSDGAHRAIGPEELSAIPGIPQISFQATGLGSYQLGARPEGDSRSIPPSPGIPATPARSGDGGSVPVEPGIPAVPAVPDCRPPVRFF